MKLHLVEDFGITYVKRTCGKCMCDFETTSSSDRIYCSMECSRLGSRKFDITKEELEIAVWEMPTLKLAIILGVSDVAIHKRCKKLGIEKPPRGYWRKLETGCL